MSITMFKGNKANQGSLFSMRFAAKLNKANEDFKPGGFFVNVVKQVSWNEKNHTGVFSGGDSVSIKLDQFEAARILHVIERNWNMGDISKVDLDTFSKQYGFYNMHSGTNQSTHINFVPWQRKGSNEQTGFALYITKVVNGEKTKFGAAFTFGEDIILREYIKLGLEHINMAGYQEDKRRFEEGNGNKTSNGNASNGESSNYSRGSSNARAGRSTERTAPAKQAPEPEETSSNDSSQEEEEPLF